MGEAPMTSLGALVEQLFSRKQEVASVIEEQSKLNDTKLIFEVENNLRVSSKTWKGDLIPFDTRIWDEQKYEVYNLPENLRIDLKQVYSDIGMANQIVWLATRFNRRSRVMEEAYSQIRLNIADRLNKIKQNVEQGQLIDQKDK